MAAETKANPPIIPAWFKQRQLEAEPVSRDVCKVTGPNLGEYYIGLKRADNHNLYGFVRTQPEGENLAATEPDFTTYYEAWEAAFELFREHVIY